MSVQLKERISNHDTYIKLGRIIQLLDSILSSDVSSNDVELLERLYETLNIIEKALDRVDPWLLSPTTLQSMNGNVSNILNSLINYENNNNVQYLNTAISHLDNAITFLPHLMITRTPEDIEGVRASVISFRKSIGQHLSNVEKEAIENSKALAENQTKLNELTNYIESQKARLDAVVLDFQDKFLSSQTERTEKNELLMQQTKIEMEKYLSEMKKIFDEKIHTQETEFTSLIENQKEKITDQINKQRDEREAQLTNERIEYDEQMEYFKEDYQNEYNEIREMNNEAEKILGLMSMKGMAQGYQKIADDEGRKAFRWSMGSVVSLLIVIGLAIAFILRHQGTMEWTDLVSRFVLTGIGITLFTYCAKQSTYHRIEERRNRKNELELASLDPYLKDMEESEQKKVKESLVNKYFGVDLPNQIKQVQKVDDNVIGNTEVIKILADKISENLSKK